MRNHSLFVAAMALAAISAPAEAVEVVINQSFDLTAPGVTMNAGFVDSNGTGAGFSPAVSEAFAVGDTLTLIYDFGAQGLSASAVNNGWANIWDWDPVAFNTMDGAPYANVNMTGTFSLLGADGSALFTTAPMTTDEGSVHVGQSLWFNTGPITFYGVMYSGILNSSSVGSRAYNLPGLQLQGQNFAIVQAPTGAVPEPGTWAMMLLGFGAVGLTMRRRGRKQPALASA